MLSIDSPCSRHVITTDKLDEISAKLEKVFLRQNTGVYHKREFQQNCCIWDLKEQLWFTDCVTQIVK